MKRADFNKAYEAAKTVKVENDQWFNCMGWFWINLTDKQLTKMAELMIEQGSKIHESTIPGWSHCVHLQNGMKIKVD